MPQSQTFARNAATQTRVVGIVTSRTLHVDTTIKLGAIDKKHITLNSLHEMWYVLFLFCIHGYCELSGILVYYYRGTDTAYSGCCQEKGKSTGTMDRKVCAVYWSDGGWIVILECVVLGAHIQICWWVGKLREGELSAKCNIQGADTTSTAWCCHQM